MSRYDDRAGKVVTGVERLRARFHDETAGPPNGTEVAMRCTDHGRFIVWVDPPLPPVRIACPDVCGAPPERGPALHVDL